MTPKPPSPQPRSIPSGHAGDSEPVERLPAEQADLLIEAWVAVAAASGGRSIGVLAMLKAYPGLDEAMLSDAHTQRGLDALMLAAYMENKAAVAALAPWVDGRRKAGPGRYEGMSALMLAIEARPMFEAAAAEEGEGALAAAMSQAILPHADPEAMNAQGRRALDQAIKNDPYSMPLIRALAEATDLDWVPPLLGSSAYERALAASGPTGVVVSHIRARKAASREAADLQSLTAPARASVPKRM